MKKSVFLALLSGTTGESSDELSKKQDLIKKSKKMIGVKLETYPSGTPFNVVEFVNKSIVGLGDLRHSQHIKLPLINDNTLTDKFEFVLVSERSSLRERIEELQIKTGDYNSKVVIDHNQYRVIHEGAGDVVLGKSDFHLYQIDTGALRSQLDAGYHNLFNFLSGNNNFSVH